MFNNMSTEKTENAILKLNDFMGENVCTNKQL